MRHEYYYMLQPAGDLSPIPGLLIRAALGTPESDRGNVGLGYFISGYGHGPLGAAVDAVVRVIGDIRVLDEGKGVAVHLGQVDTAVTEAARRSGMTVLGRVELNEVESAYAAQLHGEAIHSWFASLLPRAVSPTAPVAGVTG